MNDYMVYDRRMPDGIWWTLVEPCNMAKIGLLEKNHGYNSIQNLTIWKKDRAMEEWQKRTKGTIYKSNEDNSKSNKRKIPKHLRKAGNIHKRMKWEWKNNAI